MVMQLHECPGCGRSAEDVGPRVTRCGYWVNRIPERCIWQAKHAPATGAAQPPAPEAVVPLVPLVAPPLIREPSPSTGLPDAGFALQLDTMRRELDAARADADQIRQRLDAEAAGRATEAAARTEEATARTAAEAHAAESRKTADDAVAKHGFLHDEIARLEGQIKSLLDKKTTPDPTVPTSDDKPGETPKVDPLDETTKRLTWLRRAIDWIFVSRMKLGSISAIVGALLGAGGLGWFTHADKPATTVVTPTAPDGKASPAGGGDAAPPSGGTAQRTLSPQALQARLETALGRNRIVARLRMEDGAKVVHVDDGSTNAIQREATDAVIRAVYTGEGLPDPEIRHPAPPEAASNPIPGSGAAPANNAGPREPSNARGPAAGNRGELAANGDQREPGKRRPTEEPKDLPGKAAIPAVRAPTNEVPVTNAHSAFGKCEQQTNKSPLNPMYSWSMASCMKKECCHQGLVQNDECISYNNRFPLNCPRS